METDPIANRSETGTIAVYLTPDEALVLVAFLDRGQRAGNNYGTIEDQAELRVLWDLDAILESQLAAGLAPNYDELLQRARDAVRDSTD
jgi:hypothetical protein